MAASHRNGYSELKISYLYPFDSGLELDLGPKERYSKEILRNSQAGEVLFEGESFGQASLAAHLYPFGIGMIELSYDFKGDLARASSLAIANDKTHVGHYALPVFFQSQIDLVLQRARMFSRTAKTERLEPSQDIYNLFTLTPWQEDLGVESFLKRHRKTLFGIVTGESSYAELSEYALENERIKNIGYYNEEIILVNRYGAFLHSQEDQTLKDLIALALAQYFNARVANAYLEKALQNAERVLQDQPPYYRFWKMPGAYQGITREQREFGKEKADLMESLHAVHSQIPKIEGDWHLRSVHREFLSAFDIAEQSKTAMMRLETIDSIYSQLGEQLSTMFFIFLDFVFLAWLVVDMGGWVALIAVTAAK